MSGYNAALSPDTLAQTNDRTFYVQTLVTLVLTENVRTLLGTAVTKVWTKNVRTDDISFAYMYIHRPIGLNLICNRPRAYRLYYISYFSGPI